MLEQIQGIPYDMSVIRAAQALEDLEIPGGSYLIPNGELWHSFAQDAFIEITSRGIPLDVVNTAAGRNTSEDLALDMLRNVDDNDIEAARVVIRRTYGTALLYNGRYDDALSVFDEANLLKEGVQFRESTIKRNAFAEAMLKGMTGSSGDHSHSISVMRSMIDNASLVRDIILARDLRKSMQVMRARRASGT